MMWTLVWAQVKRFLNPTVFLVVILGVFILLWFQASSTAKRLQAQLKTATEYTKVLETQQVVIAKQEANLETHQKLLIAESEDTKRALAQTKAELDKLKIKYETVATAHASTGPIIIPQVGPPPKPDAVCVPNCVLKPGDAVSIEVGEVVLKTEDNNYVIAGAAWLADAQGTRLFGNSFNVPATKIEVKADPKLTEPLSRFSYGVDALATTQTKTMFGPSITAHLFNDHIELTGSGGLGMDAGYLHLNLSYRP